MTVKCVHFKNKKFRNLATRFPGFAWLCFSPCVGFTLQMAAELEASHPDTGKDTETERVHFSWCLPFRSKETSPGSSSPPRNLPSRLIKQTWVTTPYPKQPLAAELGCPVFSETGQDPPAELGVEIASLEAQGHRVKG